MESSELICKHNRMGRMWIKQWKVLNRIRGKRIFQHDYFILLYDTSQECPSLYGVKTGELYGWAAM